MPDRTQRRDANEISASILQTTESLFSQHGVENVSMHQIAKAANVGQGTMYRRYANKGDLCMELLHEQFNLMQAKTASYLEKSKSKPAKERLQTLLKEHIHFLETHVALIETIHNFTSCMGKKKTFFESKPYLFMHKTIGELLDEAIKANAAKPINTDFTAHTFIAAVNPKIYLFLRQKNGYSEADMIENIKKTLIDPLFS
ncbi:TetR/AcrR family transcriptional regulator [Sporolactobacillus sp. STSJ-5]|uniref:TetR/AcrR family transcriptional regulator n=1 Tax=Sporolactobacillus sp. STSJ-5 TaxID=2965076 RepID=UPI0021021EA4|nr:TetR/AcrR family transcriptional regulator [Sporolactobacillus sp. STSJ-5]MCQ2010249.1 TetR/AcrR family transcriptional regulator [Sporolactobacillus sp. STSJ-5]